MPNDAAPHDRSWLAPALVVVVAITAARLVLLIFNRTDLFVDEAQYWLWAQDLDFGYYSKPPLIAWVIRSVTEIAGSDAPFWVRFPAPLFHAATAMILASVAVRQMSSRAAVLVAAAYITLPMVAVGSLLMSTDTIMFPFLALALAGYVRLLEPGGGGRPVLALGVGATLGLAFLAKYAAVYFVILGALAALRPKTRPDTSDAALILSSFAAVIAPNLIWNTANGLSTLSHTVDNTGWRDGLSVDFLGAIRFLAEQLLVFGPVLIIGLVVASVSAGRDRSWTKALLISLSLPIIALVTVQALISGANANWAAAAYLPGLLLAASWLLSQNRIWLVLSFTINGALCLALPIASTQADRFRLGDRLVLERYLGLDELSLAILAEARSQGATAIVAAERAVLADLLYTGRNQDMEIHAWPWPGPPRNHYEQRYLFPGVADGQVLAVTRGAQTPPCAEDGSHRIIKPGPGAYENSTFSVWLVPQDCWTTR